jgi:hypothetical protein
VSWSPVAGRTSVNLEQLRTAAAAAGFDLTPYEQVGESSDRLIIQVLDVCPHLLEQKVSEHG